MHWSFSLIVWDQETTLSGISVAKKHPWEISRIKHASQSISNWDLLLENVRETQEAVADLWISAYVWWGITDAAIRDGDISRHIKDLQAFWIDTVEVWNPSNEILRILQSEFATVISEIWSKSRSDRYSRDYKAWERSLKTSLDNGIQDIIIEWGTWSVGIYTPQDRVRTFLLLYLMKQIDELGYTWDVILEATDPWAQDYMYSIFGQNIHLWNIIPSVSFNDSLDAYNVRKIRKLNPKYTSERLAAFYELVDNLFAVAKERGISPNDLIFHPTLTSINWEEVFEVAQEVKRSFHELVAYENGWRFSMDIVLWWDSPLGQLLWGLLTQILEKESL